MALRSIFVTQTSYRENSSGSHAPFPWPGVRHMLEISAARERVGRVRLECVNSDRLFTSLIFGSLEFLDRPHTTQKVVETRFSQGLITETRHAAGNVR